MVLLIDRYTLCDQLKNFFFFFTRNTVMRRAADYLDLTKPNIAALDYTAAVRTCGALNLQIHTSFSSGPNRNVTTVCRKKTFFGVCVDRSQSLFYFVPQESHSQAGSTRSVQKY